MISRPLRSILPKRQLLLLLLVPSYFQRFVVLTSGPSILTKGIIRAKHSGTHSALGQYSIRTGELPAHLSDLYTLLQGERELADYRLSVDPPWEDVIELRIDQARTFVATIRDYLHQNGFLTS
jgi:hypothetical protein